ncbi:MAG: hypothetical protein AAGA17_08550 [Actinomycetota bacterium]
MSVLLVVLVICLGVALLGRAVVARASAVPGTGHEWRRREHQAAIYWAAVRHGHRGLTGADLQEAVCVSVGCTPTEADAAIALVETERSLESPPWL